MIKYRRLLAIEANVAADLHRLAGALIPGYDTSLHSQAEFHALYTEKVMIDGPVWGGFEAGQLRGFVALQPGWIDHLYVDQAHHRRGIGSALVKLAQGQQDDFQLYTFQANINARRMYERHGFVVTELTDGQRNEEKMPDATYRWSRTE